MQLILCISHLVSEGYWNRLVELGFFLQNLPSQTFFYGSPFAHLSVCLFCQFVCLFDRLLICLSNRQLISEHLLVYLYICLCLFVSVCLAICLLDSVFVHWFICLIVCSSHRLLFC